MQHFILVFAIIFTSFLTHGQDTLQTKTSERKCLVGLWPISKNSVNGLMFNILPYDMVYSDYTKTVKMPTTNGLELNISPVGALAAWMGAVHYIFNAGAREPLCEASELDTMIILSTSYKTINGLQLGTMTMDDTKVNGIDIQFGGGYTTLVNGIAIAPLGNKRVRINGLTIGGIGNFDVEVNGVQIGILNTAKRLRGFQFGLWNKNQKRSLPFINWSF